ncbi:MAG TPA: hypothetical protein VK658_25985 [Chryseolinea sp.]|nr:hypothetical protein [Chryseolinea sp.]
MNSRLEDGSSRRILFIDFSLYTDDDDPNFKQELIQLMTDNLKELHEAYRHTIEQNDPGHFVKACHKVTTTLIMLADQEFTDFVETLKTAERDEMKSIHLYRLCTEITASLSSELI